MICINGSKEERTGRCRHGVGTYRRPMAGLAVLNAICEEDFLGFSYGFRPKRSQHDALDALIVGMMFRKVNHIFDADIRSFFDTVEQSWLLRFLKPRILHPWPTQRFAVKHPRWAPHAGKPHVRCCAGGVQ